MPREARDHEHRVALDGGPDGLDVQRRVVAEARAWLRPGGRILIETSRGQAPETAALLTAAGFTATVETDDEVGGTVVWGRC
jgi:release factor glutamine methyltransferase